MYEGDPTGWLQVAAATGLRSLFVMPGLALAGVRGRKLVVASLAGSVGITLALFAVYGLRRAGIVSWKDGA